MNKKEECPECKRKLRTKCFVFNKIKKTRICNQCDKRIGSNIFYVPFKQKRDYIGKYSINKQEKYRLWKKYVSQGYGYKNAWRMVYICIGELGNQRRIKNSLRKRDYLGKISKEKQKKDMKEKFIGGLK